jgi:hypothetical protein
MDNTEKDGVELAFLIGSFLNFSLNMFFISIIIFTIAPHFKERKILYSTQPNLSRNFCPV